MKTFMLGLLLVLFMSANSFAQDGLIIIFGKPDCRPCLNLMKSLEDENVQRALSTFQVTYIDASKRADLVDTFKIDTRDVPVVVIAIRKDNILLEIDRSHGYKRPRDLVKWLQKWKSLK